MPNNIDWEKEVKYILQLEYIQSFWHITSKILVSVNIDVVNA